MKEIEFKKLKEEYNELIKDRDKLKTIKDRMAELEKMPEIQEYIKLSSQVNMYTHGYISDFEKRTNPEIISEIVASGKITPTSDIYYYLGSSMKYDDGYTEIVDEKRDDAEYYKFCNIEEKYDAGSVSVIPSKLETFKANHIVVFPTVLHDCRLSYTLAKNEFFNIYFNEGYLEATAKFMEYAKTGYPWSIH